MVVFFHENTDYLSKVTIDINGNKVYLLIIRIFAVIGLIPILIGSFIYVTQVQYYTLFTFSNWGAIISFLAFSFMLITSLFEYCFASQSLTPKISIVLFECAWTCQGVITIFFWGVLVWIEEGLFSSLNLITIFNCVYHLFAMILLIADYLINNISFSPAHLIFPLVIAFVFMIVSIVVSYTLDFTPYEILTWKDWFSFVVAFGVLLLFIATFFFGYFWIT